MNHSQWSGVPLLDSTKCLIELYEARVVALCEPDRDYFFWDFPAPVQRVLDALQRHAAVYGMTELRLCGGERYMVVIHWGQIALVGDKPRVESMVRYGEHRCSEW